MIQCSWHNKGYIYIQKLKDREEEVCHLSEQLKEAAKEMESSAVLIAQLKKAKT